MYPSRQLTFMPELRFFATQKEQEALIEQVLGGADVALRIGDMARSNRAAPTSSDIAHWLGARDVGTWPSNGYFCDTIPAMVGNEGLTGQMTGQRFQEGSCVQFVPSVLALPEGCLVEGRVATGSRGLYASQGDYSRAQSRYRKVIRVFKEAIPDSGWCVALKGDPVRPRIFLSSGALQAASSGVLLKHVELAPWSYELLPPRG